MTGIAMTRIDGYDFPDDRWYDPREHLWVLPGTTLMPATTLTAATTLTTATTLTAKADTAGETANDVTVTVGIDALGQEALGEVVYVQLVEAGVERQRGEAVGSLEAEKMVRPILAPLTGAIIEVNASVTARPRVMNEDPYGAGWLFRMRAARWSQERRALLHGSDTIHPWVRAELARGRVGA